MDAMLPEPMQETVSSFDRGLAFLFRQRILLLVLAGLGAAGGFGGSYFFTPMFKADAVLTPSDELLGLNEAGALGNLGGLASLVGLGKSGNKENEAIETLKSRALVRSYIDEKGLLPIIFHNRWDTSTNKWKVDSQGHVPTLEDGFKKFDERILSVVENHKTGLIRISVTWEDPALAKEWADGLIDAANDRLRTRAVDRSARTLEYLEKISTSISAMEVRATIYKLIESEIKKQMIIAGGKDYAFRVVDPPVLPEHKFFPKRSLFLVLGALLLPAIYSLIIALRGYKGVIR
jgi:uncharacterized protein involved in exopolysaccharide biosynthesis